MKWVIGKPTLPGWYRRRFIDLPKTADIIKIYPEHFIPGTCKHLFAPKWDLYEWSGPIKMSEEEEMNENNSSREGEIPFAERNNTR